MTKRGKVEKRETIEFDEITGEAVYSGATDTNITAKLEPTNDYRAFEESLLGGAAASTNDTFGDFPDDAKPADPFATLGDTYGANVVTDCASSLRTIVKSAIILCLQPLTHSCNA